MPATYRPGEWQVIVTPDAVVALPPGTPADIAARMWDRIRRERALATVIDVLAAPVGGALAALPSFAAVLVDEDGVRVALRGEVSARVAAGSGDHDLTGADVDTWSERFVAGASVVELTLAAAADGAGGLPLADGVVLASSVTVAAAAAPAAGAPAGASTALPPPSETDRAAPDAPPPPPGEAPFAPAAGELTLAPPPEEADPAGEETVHSAPEPPPVVVDDTVSTAAAGDHDGSTVTVAELEALRGRALAADGVVPAAATGRIRLSTGQVVTLDRPVVIGRRPRATRASAASLPHLVAIDSPEQDISRSHLEIRPESGTVVVVDLHTTNGSTLLRPGADALRLHPGEQTLVVSGDVVDIGDGVRVTFEDLP